MVGLVTKALAVNFRANTDSYHATVQTLTGATRHTFDFDPSVRKRSGLVIP